MGEVSYIPLGNALDRLREALVLWQTHREDHFAVSMRNSVLLSFQFTYGLCRPMIERFLVNDGDDPSAVEQMSYAAIVRTANERGLLQATWTEWSSFPDARNQMAHAYSEPVTEGILAKVPGFLHAAAFLYEQLVARSATP